MENVMIGEAMCPCGCGAFWWQVVDGVGDVLMERRAQGETRHELSYSQAFELSPADAQVLRFDGLYENVSIRYLSDTGISFFRRDEDVPQGYFFDLAIEQFDSLFPNAVFYVDTRPDQAAARRARRSEQLERLVSELRKIAWQERDAIDEGIPGIQDAKAQSWKRDRWEAWHRVRQLVRDVDGAGS